MFLRTLLVATPTKSSLARRLPTDGAQRGSPHSAGLFGRLGIFWTTFRPETRYFTVARSTGTLSRSLGRLLFRTETGWSRVRDCVEVDQKQCCGNYLRHCAASRNTLRKTSVVDRRSSLHRGKRVLRSNSTRCFVRWQIIAAMRRAAVRSGFSLRNRWTKYCAKAPYEAARAHTRPSKGSSGTNRRCKGSSCGVAFGGSRISCEFPPIAVWYGGRTTKRSFARGMKVDGRERGKQYAIRFDRCRNRDPGKRQPGSRHP